MGSDKPVLGASDPEQSCRSQPVLPRRLFLPVGLSGAVSSNIGSCGTGCGRPALEDSGSRRMPVNISTAAEEPAVLLAVAARFALRHLDRSKVNIVVISGLQLGGTGITLDILLLINIFLMVTWLTAR